MFIILAAMVLIQNSGQMVSGNLANQVIDVITVNAFVPLSVIHMNQETEIKDVANYINFKVRSGSRDVEEAKNLVVASKEDELEPLLPFLINGKHQMSILYFIGQIDDIDLYKVGFTSKLKDIEEGFYFYFVLESDGRLFWYYVLSIQRMFSPIIGQVIINNDSVIKEKYDLRGMTIKSITVPYPPLFTIDCDGTSKNCKTGGFTSDITSFLATKLNFTLEYHREPNDNAGVIAVSGPNNVSGTFEGVFGALVKADQYQISICNYVMVSYRLDMFDFVRIFTSHMLLGMMLRKSNVDYGLFMRPFQIGLWFTTGIFTVLIFAILIFISLKDKEGKMGNRRRAVTIAGWFLLLLISSYYCGALTMYFTSSPFLPFETINDVLKAHPDWTLTHLRGTQVRFFSNPDPDFVTYWSSIKNQLEKYSHADSKEAFKRLENEKTIAYISSSRFQHYLKNNPDMRRNVRSFAHQKPYHDYLIIPKGSPLGIIMRQAFYELEESGLFSYLYVKHFGDSVKRRRYTSMMDSLVTLSAGQVILIFLIMVTTILSVLCILVLEFLWKKFLRRRTRDRRVHRILVQAGRQGKQPPLNI